MKTIKLQANIEISYETSNHYSERHLINEVTRNFRNSVEATLDIPGDVELVEWDIAVKEIDTDKEKFLAEAHRETSFGKISGYFSSDGPAVTVSLREPYSSSPFNDVGIFQDISSVLREAHHRYIRFLREG